MEAEEGPLERLEPCPCPGRCGEGKSNNSWDYLLGKEMYLFGGRGGGRLLKQPELSGFKRTENKIEAKQTEQQPRKSAFFSQFWRPEVRNQYHWAKIKVAHWTLGSFLPLPASGGSWLVTAALCTRPSPSCGMWPPSCPCPCLCVCLPHLF